MPARANTEVVPGLADSERGLSSVAAAYRRADPYLAASSTLMASVAGFTALGYGLDRWLGHTVQWMLVAGSVVGIALGFVGFFTKVLRADAAARRQRACAPARPRPAAPTRSSRPRGGAGTVGRREEVQERCTARDEGAAVHADGDAADARHPGAFVVQYEEVGVDGPLTRVLGVFSSMTSSREALRELERTRSLVVHASITSWTVDVARPRTSVEIDL